jgi:hypothetical protein
MHCLFTWILASGTRMKKQCSTICHASQKVHYYGCTFDGGHSMDSYFECTHNEYGQLLKDGGQH